jgi:hypothetical protein
MGERGHWMDFADFAALGQVLGVEVARNRREKFYSDTEP